MKPKIHTIQVPNDAKSSLILGEVAFDDVLTIHAGDHDFCVFYTPSALGALLPEPDWSEAPDWAQYWAVDSSGKAYWYEREPDRDNVMWGPNLIQTEEGERHGLAPTFVGNPLVDALADDRGDPDWTKVWKHTLVKRPTEESKPAPVLQPDWSEAPEWAQYWVVNSVGCCFWFECEPIAVASNPGYIDFGRTRGRSICTSTRGKQYAKPDELVIIRRSFEPPWDKIASPFDHYEFLPWHKYPRFSRRDGIGYVYDTWSDPATYEHIKTPRCWSRPGVE